MVNLREIKLHIGVDYGEQSTNKLQNTHEQSLSQRPRRMIRTLILYSVSIQAFCVSPPRQMIHGRTTESPPAKP